jgi:hypothetical protein
LGANQDRIRHSLKGAQTIKNPEIVNSGARARYLRADPKE